MSELSDWVWLALAGIWIVTRVLPRLFRSSKGEAPRDQVRPAPGRAAAPPGKDPRPRELARPEPFSEGPYGRTGDEQPKPIEPR